MTHLPPPTDDIAGLVEAIGAEAALRLFEQRGGTRLYVASPEKGDAIVEMLGLDAATRLHAKYGRGDMRVPLARSWRVLCYIAIGLSGPKAALKAGCTEKNVAAILKRHGRPAIQQLDLFARSA
ncbi:hypothetical protein [Bosea sp. 685]|uniref:hypothetical protein n=1 Tax=Bosea sp. 685 TaxID=3080057 RepID=UPI002892BFD2|nr:hypothetical protein [Bosea sp. 685]WNJ89150.1 hypothetical protein RMR04_22425 [Bosea sp. 685]